MKTAKHIARELEPILLKELIIGPQPQEKTYSETDLIELFMNAKHNWKPRTYEYYNHCLNYYQNRGLSPNPNTRAMIIRCINRVYNWAYEEGLISCPKRIKGGNKYEPRHRVFTKEELDLIFNNAQSKAYGDFIKFAYYTGARQSEIRVLSPCQVSDGFIEVKAKTGTRIIKLNSQAKELLNEQNMLWNYSKNVVSKRFKAIVRRLEIKNARFHDLRRSFGYHLILQGKPIYEVSKLLGHSSVSTTEKHYAPLLVNQIDDFIL
tara:strand:+ start:81 stop:869 length:789 start_codon:yes stop_codon:yes gene_type:complete